MTITHSLFKAYDIRGLVGTELTPEVAEAVGRAFADWLPSAGAVAVGYDMRPDSFELAASVRDGLVRQGREVIDIGCVASDMIYFAVGSLGAAGGAMVTASHNPGKYNGIKLCGEGARPVSLEAGLAAMRDAIIADEFKPAAPGSVREQSVMDAWITHALGFIDTEAMKPFHIAVDAGNGMGGAVVPHLAGRWPVTVEPLYFELDGTFPNHIANPLIEENNRDLIAKVQAENLDFGVAFDGDGDRAFLVDELGRTVPGNIMSAFLAKYFLQQFPGSNIIFDARNSRLVEAVIAENGGTGIRSRVGHSYIKQAMREYDAPFGGEFSGHYYFRDNYYADSGLIGALVAIQVVSESGKKLSELVNEYSGRFARSPEVNFEVQDKDAKLTELTSTFADGRQDRFDGLTVNYPEWWFNVRASNTEPYLRLNVEATSQALLDEKMTQIKGILEA